MTYERKQQIIEAGKQMYENFRPAVDLVNAILEKVREIVVKIYEWLKQILNVKITTFF